MYDDDAQYGKVVVVKQKNINIRGRNKKGVFAWWSVPHNLQRRQDILKLDRKLRDKIVKIYKYQDQTDIFLLTADGIQTIEQFLEQDSTRQVKSFEQKRKLSNIVSTIVDKFHLKDVISYSIMAFLIFK